MPNPSTYFAGKFSSKAAVACIVDTSLPTFAGIASVTPQNDGSFVVTWVAATSTKTPVRYEIYAAPGSISAAALFVTANRVVFAPGAVTSWRLFVLRDQVTFFNQGSTYTFGIRAVDSQNFVDTNVVVLTSVCGAINYGTVAAAVWDQLQAAHTLAGSFGLFLDALVSSRAPASTAVSNVDYTTARAAKIDNLDATISSRAPAATALSTVQWTNARAALLDFLDVAVSSRAPAATALSTAQWTNARAALLDFLDVAISTRAPASTALSTAQWTNARAALLDFLDVAISSRAPAATALSTAQWTNARAALLDFLDVAISSRLATAGYTAPDNVDIVAIKAQTDKFLFNGSNFVKADAEVTIDDANILAIKAKTDNLPADPASNTQVNTRLASSDSRLNNLDATISSREPSSDPRLAHLDADVSSRLPTSSYVAPDNADISAIKAKTDNLPSDPASNTQVNTRLASSDGRLNDLDAPISTRLPASSYVAPDNSDIVAIKAKTDQLTFAVDGVNAHTNNIPAVNVQAIVDGVLDEQTSLHTQAGSVGKAIAVGGTGGGGGGGGTVFRGRLISPERLTGQIQNPQRLRGVVIKDD